MNEIIFIQELANAIVLQACEDYRSALRRKKYAAMCDIEDFFRSDWFRMLTTVDGEYLIDKLRKEGTNENYKTIP